MKYDKIILDTDICIKIGGYVKVKFLEIIIPNICNKAYIHEYVYKDELLTPKNARNQIDNLMKDGIIEILREDNLDKLDKNIYDDTKDKLKKYMIGTEEKGKNWGECVSISMAKTLNIPYFLSDEKQLQSIIDRYINTGGKYDLEVVRMNDVIRWIKENKECNINRKTAKALWRSAGKSNEIFDKELWNI